MTTDFLALLDIRAELYHLTPSFFFDKVYKLIYAENAKAIIKQDILTPKYKEKIIKSIKQMDDPVVVPRTKEEEYQRYQAYLQHHK